MNNDQCDAVIEMLEDVLDAECAALLGGDLDGMRRLVDRKEKLVEQFATVPDPDLQSGIFRAGRRMGSDRRKSCQKLFLKSGCSFDAKSAARSEFRDLSFGIL